MPTYITLVNWTDQGIRSIKESPQRLDSVRAAIQAAGGRMTGFYMVMGQYDLVVVSEFPNDEAYARNILATASLGNVRSTTLKAFPEAEYRRIIAGLSEPGSPPAPAPRAARRPGIRTAVTSPRTPAPRAARTPGASRRGGGGRA